MRFFGRAVVAYEEGLSKFPNSFDLAYNKFVARKCACSTNLFAHYDSGREFNMISRSIRFY